MRLSSVSSELKTLEWYILNHDRLVWLSNVHTFDFIINPLFGYFYCMKVTFDNNYRYNAVSIELYPIELKSAVHKTAFRAFKQILIVLIWTD